MDPVALLKGIAGVDEIIVRPRVASYLELPDGSARRFEPSHELVMVRTEALGANQVTLFLRDGDVLVKRTLFIYDARRFLKYVRAVKVTDEKP